MAATVTGFAIDTNAGDIQPPGPSALAGSTGKAADAGHVHPLTGVWPGTAAGDMAYGGTGGVQTRLPGNTTAARQFLTSTGTGSAAAAPAWNKLRIADLPAGYGSSWINVTSAPYSADPSGSADSTAGINAALTAAAPFGAAVYIPYGTYKTTAPLQPPPCVTILTDGAQENTTWLDSSLGTIIQPAATWAQGSCPANAVIAVLGQTDASPNYAVPANDTKITGLYVDCHLLPATLSSTDGIQLYGGVGRCHLERILIGHAPNCGFNVVTDGGGNGPGSYRLDRVTVRYAGQATTPAQGYGFWINKTSDISGDDCLAENCFSHGVAIVNLSNGILTKWRSEHNGTSGVGDGFNYQCTNSSTGSGTALLVGCSSDRNEGNGCSVSSPNASGVPVQLVGCRFRRDGRNGGTGGGSLAGIYITAFPGTVIIDGTTVFPGVSDTGTETLSPQIGLRIASNAASGNVLVSGSYLQGATTAIADDGSSSQVLYDQACLSATGPTGSPVVFGPRAGTSSLSTGGAVAVACTSVRTGSQILITWTSQGANSGTVTSVSKSPGTGFTVSSNNTSDRNSFNWICTTP